MTRLAITGVILLSTLALGAGNYLQYQQLQTQRERAAEAELLASSKQRVIDALEVQAQVLHEAQQILDKRQSALRIALGQREQRIQQLEIDNESYRTWAAAQLPDAARRLRQRPAITGADQYRQFLSDNDTLPATGDSSRSQRRPDG